MLIVRVNYNIRLGWMGGEQEHKRGRGLERHILYSVQLLSLIIETHFNDLY